MRALVVLVYLGGCGRIAFDPLEDASVPASGRCPENYVFVAGNAALGSEDFCVMKFEAKARDVATGDIRLDGCDLCAGNALVTTHIPAAVPAGIPWQQIDAEQAQRRCQALGAGYDIIANAEWMTIAREVDAVGANWFGGMPGSGRIPEGNTQGGVVLAVSDVTDPYSDTGNSAAQPPGQGWEQRRTIVLASGEVIFDMPGNVQEWIDWTIGGAIDGAPTPCTSAELPLFSCPGITNDHFNSSTGTYDSSHGMGRIIGGSGNATRRGGQHSDRSMMIAGVYALNMNRFTTDILPATGFRCVLRDPP